MRSGTGLWHSVGRRHKLEPSRTRSLSQDSQHCSIYDMHEVAPPLWPAQAKCSCWCGMSYTAQPMNRDEIFMLGVRGKTTHKLQIAIRLAGAAAGAVTGRSRRRLLLRCGGVGRRLPRQLLVEEALVHFVSDTRGRRASQWATSRFRHALVTSAVLRWEEEVRVWMRAKCPGM